MQFSFGGKKPKQKRPIVAGADVVTDKLAAKKARVEVTEFASSAEATVEQLRVIPVAGSTVPAAVSKPVAKQSANYDRQSFGLQLMNAAGKTAKSQQKQSRLLLKPVTIDELKDADDDAYDEVPVEDFGMALLRGMGHRDEAVGATSQEKLTRATRRPERLGLGAKLPTMPDKPNNI